MQLLTSRHLSFRTPLLAASCATALWISTLGGCAVHVSNTSTPGGTHSAAPKAARAIVPAGAEDTALRQKLEAVTNGFHGEVGVYVRNLRTGATVAIAADDTFPTASIVKIPLLITLFDQARLGNVNLDSLYTLTDSTIIQNDGDDAFAPAGLGTKMEPRKMAYLMMSLSDNTASVWIQTLIGGSQVANAWLEQEGYAVTRDNSRVAERRPLHRRWGWGMTSPREIASLLVSIRNGEVISPDISEEMYRSMTRSYWRNEALSAIPSDVQVASKQGAVNASRSEVLLVHAPAGDYVLSILTKNNEDQRWVHDNEAYIMIRRASWTVYNHFNPDDPWRPEWLR
jgi:beta-lactamase class A